MCKNQLFRRTSPVRHAVRDSHGQWSICNDRGLYPVSTSPAKTQNRNNEDRTSTSHLDLVISIRMYRYVIFESQRKPMTARKSICCESQFSSPPHVCLASPPGGEPQRPLPAMCAPFTQEWWHHHMTPVQEHPSLNEPIAALSSGDVKDMKLHPDLSARFDALQQACTYSPLPKLRFS